MTDRMKLAKLLEPLFKNLVSRTTNERGVQEEIATYVSVLEGFSLEAIELAVQDFMAGRVPGQSLEFRPKAPALCARVRHHANRLADDMARQRRIKQQSLDRLPPPDEPTPEQRAEIARRMLARFHSPSTAE